MSTNTTPGTPMAELVAQAERREAEINAALAGPITGMQLAAALGTYVAVMRDDSHRAASYVHQFMQAMADASVTGCRFACAVDPLKKGNPFVMLDRQARADQPSQQSPPQE